MINRLTTTALFLLTIAFLLFPLPVSAAPQITNISLNTTNVPKYEKLEITFQVNNTVASNVQLPYEASPPPGVLAGQGISVNALFTPDNWQTVYTQPAYYHQFFTLEQRNNRDWAYPTGEYAWKVRFAPPSSGTWQYRLTALDSSGDTQSDTQSFVVTQSSNKGFIRVSQQDPRYFEYEDGTYFPGLGYNFRPNTTDIEANQSHFATMSQNGIQLGRMWLSSWSIFGSSWNPWNAMPQDYDGYLPRTGLEAYQGDFRLKLVYRASNPSQPSCTDNCSWWKATRFLGWLSPQAAVKPNTNYRIQVRYQAQNISGPRNPAYPSFGLVIKVANQWLEAPHQAGNGSPNSAYAGNVTGWTNLTTTWNSGTNNFLPYTYITLENVIDPGSGSPAPVVYIDSVLIQEELGNGQYGPNILPKPSMQHHTYFDQKTSDDFDRLIDLAKANNVYLRAVILEKDEYIQNHIDFAGNLRTDDLPNLFYGDGRNTTAVRWYQQAWWRYLQARWGYSTAIHSWELINEGNPNLQNHYLLTDELGKYMRQFAPNQHLVSTSNWHSFPAVQWAAQPNIDFADVHYYQPRSATEEFFDTALAHLNRSLTYTTLNTNVGKPVIRGETGFVESGSGPSVRDLDADSQGIWLHNFTWSQLNQGGMLESYWYTGGVDGHIFRTNGPDHRPVFKTFYDFIANIPLSNGNYGAVTPLSTPTNTRIVGQQDTLHNRAHLWIQNTQHTWKNVVDNIAINPVNATVTLTDFTPNTVLRVETFNTYTGTSQVTSRTTSSAGNLELPVQNLTTDIAFKVGTYSQTTPSPTPTINYSMDGDNDIDFADFVAFILRFNQSGNPGNFNSIGLVDIFDFNSLLRIL